MADTIPPTRRRWFRFGLRGGLLAIAVLALPLGLHVDKVHRQRAAITKIVQLGGNVVYDFQVKRNDNGLYEAIGGQSNALAKWLGVDHVHSLFSVSLSGQQIAEDDLRLIARVPSVHGIDLQSTNVSAALLRCLAILPDLQGLNLRDTRLDDECMTCIATHKRLKLLNLSRTGLSNASLERLETLPDLVWVDLSETPLTDKGLLHFDKLKMLEWLVVRQTQVTVEGVERLRAALPDAQVIFP